MVSGTMGYISARIIGSDRCEALGITVRSATPIMAMCRRLLSVGHDPASSLRVYHGNTLALTVSSIDWGAKHTVVDKWRDLAQAHARESTLPSSLGPQ
jgi:hypothetical protein